MALAEKALITADEFRQLPEGPPFYQLIDGELFMSPSPESFHQRIILNLAVTLENYLEKKPIGEVYIAPLDVYFTEFNVFEPDLIFISKARLHLVDRWIEGAPDLVAEVLSPSTARLDARKPKIYAAAGVTEMWVLDPKARTISAYDLQSSADQPKSVSKEGERVASPLLPGLKIPVAKIFGRRVDAQ